MKIVLNTSPIIFLSKVDCLVLLNDFIAETYVPQIVVKELQEYRLPSFIQIRPLSDVGIAYVQGALGRLHQGELEAMLLAQELKADYVVLDDLLARRKAQRLGLNVMGTIGILLLMKKKNLLSTAQTWEKIQLLTHQHGMYLSQSLQQEIQRYLYKTN